MRPSCPVLQHAPQVRQSIDFILACFRRFPCFRVSCFILHLHGAGYTQTMRYLCVHCDEKFTWEDASGAKARCPKCLRATGIEPLKQEPAVATGKTNKWLPLGLGLIALFVTFGIWKSQQPPNMPEEVPMAMLSPKETAVYLKRHNISSETWSRFLTADAEVKTFLRGLNLPSGSDAKPTAQAITKAIQTLKQKGTIAPWFFSIPRETPVMPSSVVAGWLNEGKSKRYYPFELAALGVAIMREQGIPSMIAEVSEWPNEGPADPGGKMGYFVVATYKDEVGKGAAEYWDIYGGRTTLPSSAKALNDMQAMGAVENMQAVHSMMIAHKSDEAFKHIERAKTLYPDSSTIRSVRGTILLNVSSTEEGLKEIEAAKELSDDAVRWHDLATVYMMKGEFEDATRAIETSLKRNPKYVAPYASKAMLAFQEGKDNEALSLLRQAETLDRSWPQLASIWAQYHAKQGNITAAIPYAKKAIALTHGDISTRLLAGSIYRAAGMYRDMREQARAIMRDTPSAKTQQMEAAIKQLMGPTALDPEDEEDTVAEDTPSLPNSGFQLGSKLLGEEGAGSPATSGNLQLADPSAGSSSSGFNLRGEGLGGGNLGSRNGSSFGGDFKLDLNP